MSTEQTRARYTEVLARAEYEKDRELNVLPGTRPPWERATAVEQDYYRNVAVPHLIDALAAADLPPLPPPDQTPETTP